MAPNVARTRAGRQAGTRRRGTLRQTPQVTAARIATSIITHRALGIEREPESYSSEPSTLAIVRALVGEGE